jgi:hypothetical protein
MQVINIAMWLFPRYMVTLVVFVREVATRKRLPVRYHVTLRCILQCRYGVKTQGAVKVLTYMRRSCLISFLTLTALHTVEHNSYKR